MCGFEPPPAGLCGRQRAPAPGLDDQGDLLQRVGREHGAHLGVARWCRLTPGITHSFSKRRGRSVWTARASWPGSAHDQQFTPSQCHSIWPYRPGMNGNPSASTWTRRRYGFASALSCSTARCCSDSCLRTALAGAASPFIFPGRKPKACQGRSATLHCLASALPGRYCGRRNDAHAATHFVLECGVLQRLAAKRSGWILMSRRRRRHGRALFTRFARQNEDIA